MGEGESINWDDILNLGDDSKVNEAIKLFEKLGDSFAAVIKNMEANVKNLEGQYDKIIAKSRESVEQMNKLDLSKQQDRDGVKDITRQSADMLKMAQQNQKLQIDHAKAIKDVEKAQDSLNKAKEATNKKFVAEAGSVLELKNNIKTLKKEWESIGDKGKRTGIAKQISEMEAEYKKATQAIKAAKKEVIPAAGSIDELKNRIKENKKALVAMGGSMDSTSEEAIKLKNEILKDTESLNEFNQSLKVTKKVIQPAEGSIDALAQSIKDLEKEYYAMGAAFSDAEKKMKADKIKELKLELTDQKDALKANKAEAELAAGSYKKLEKELSDAKKELKEMAGSLDLTSDRQRELQKFIAQGTAKLKAWDDAINENNRNVGNYRESLKDLFQGLQQSRGGIGSIIGSIGSALPPQLAAVSGVVVGLGAVLEDLDDTAQQVRKEMTETQKALGLMGDELKEVTALTRATSDVFEKDYTEVLRATNVLMEEFKLSGEDANKELNKLLITSADLSGDILDQVSEYSVQFNKAGLSAGDLMKTLSFASDKGIWNDKLPDSIKEGGLRIREMTKATEDALKPLGDLTIEQARQLSNEGKSFEAIKLVTAEMKKRNLTAAQYQTIIADVFSAAGEDAGDAKLLEFLETLGNESENVKVKLTDLQKEQLKYLESVQDLERAQVKMTESLGLGGKKLDIFLNTLRVFGINLLIQFWEALLPIREAYTEMYEAFGELVSLFKDSDDTIQNQITGWDIFTKVIQLVTSGTLYLVKGVTWVIQTFNGWADSSDNVKDAISEITRIFKVFLWGLENAPHIIAGLKAATSEYFSFLVDTAKTTFPRLKEMFLAVFDPTTSIDDVINKYKAIADKRKGEVKNAYIKAFRESKREAMEAALADQKDIAKQEGDVTKDKLDKEYELTEEQKKKLAKLAKRAAKARYNLDEAKFKAYLDKLKARYEDETRLESERILAANEIAAQRIKLAELEYNKAYETAKEVKEELELLDYQHAQKLEAIERERIDRVEELRAEAIANEIDQFTEGYAQITVEEVRAANGRVELLRASYAEGNLTIAELAQEKEEIERQTEDRILARQEQFLRTKLDLLKKHGQETADVEQQIADLREQINSRAITNIIESEERLAAYKQEIKTDLRDTILETTESLLSGEQERIDQRIEKLEFEREMELNLAGDNADKKAEIEAKYVEERKKLEKEKSKADRKQAIFERAKALFSIGINTAVGIQKAVAASPLSGGLPWSAIVAGIGALQAVAVLSKPLPQYATGVEDSPEGWAIINELGPELLHNKKTGESHMVYSDGPTLTYLQKGTTVYPADKTKEMLIGSEAGILTAKLPGDYEERVIKVINADNSGMVTELKSGFARLIRKNDELLNAISRDNTTESPANEAGIRKILKRRQSITKYLGKFE